MRLLRDKMSLNGIQLERAHRVGPPNHRSFGGPARPRTIVARFTRYTDRETTLRNSAKLKNTDIFVNEDLCEASILVRKSKLPELKKARLDGKIAFFNHTRLVIRDRKEKNETGSRSENPGHPTAGENSVLPLGVGGDQETVPVDSIDGVQNRRSLSETTSADSGGAVGGAVGGVEDGGDKSQPIQSDVETPQQQQSVSANGGQDSQVEAGGARKRSQRKK